MEVVNIESKAKALAESCLKDRFRASGEAYITHVSKVVYEVKSIGITEENLIALAYLHHNPDFDNDYYAKIANEFDVNLADLVKGYHDFAHRHLPLIRPGHANEKIIIQTFLNLINDPKLLVVRLIDRAESIKTAHMLHAEKREENAYKALYIYSPVCQLTGLYKYVRILEDNALKLLDPKNYYFIKKYRGLNKSSFENELNEAKSVISEFLHSEDIHHDLKYRVKHTYSIYKKIKRKYGTVNEEGLYKIKDIVAMRIVVDTVEDCYKTEDILNSLFEPYPEERDDYISKPTPSGYRSLHNLYKLTNDLDVEIQIKTYQMHEFNEFGVASHFVYKTGAKFSKDIQGNPNILKDLNFFEGNELKIDHFANNVYVFTPAGDIIELPKGANLIDFAYSIHFDIGNRCIAGKVNGEVQKLTYELKDGDYVEIKTSNQKKKPSFDWLKDVKTKRASDSIHKALKS